MLDKYPFSCGRMTLQQPDLIVHLPVNSSYFNARRIEDRKGSQKLSNSTSFFFLSHYDNRCIHQVKFTYHLRQNYTKYTVQKVIFYKFEKYNLEGTLIDCKYLEQENAFSVTNAVHIMTNRLLVYPLAIFLKWKTCFKSMMLKFVN